MVPPAASGPVPVPAPAPGSGPFDPVTAPFEYCLHVPHDPRAVGVARASLRAALAAHGLDDLAERAELLACELLTNALVHARCAAHLRMKWRRETLRLSVWDTSPEPPDPKEMRPGGEGGRGLHLLAAVADRWDHYPLRADLFGVVSKVVWCEIGRTPPDAA